MEVKQLCGDPDQNKTKKRDGEGKNTTEPTGKEGQCCGGAEKSSHHTTVCGGYIESVGFWI